MLISVGQVVHIERLVIPKGWGPMPRINRVHPYRKILVAGLGCAQVVEHLLNKHKVLSSSSSTTSTKKT
jgi:hypothetical protein